MSLILEPAEAWRLVLDAVSLNTAKTTTAERFVGETGIAGIRDSVTELEWRVKIAGASVDDVLMELFRAPYDALDADAPGHFKGTLPDQSRVIQSSVTDPSQQSGWFSFAEVGSGYVFDFSRTGSENGITLSFWLRRVRWVDKA